MQSVYRTAFN